LWGGEKNFLPFKPSGFPPVFRPFPTSARGGPSPRPPPPPQQQQHPWQRNSVPTKLLSSKFIYKELLQIIYVS